MTDTASNPQADIARASELGAVARFLKAAEIDPRMLGMIGALLVTLGAPEPGADKKEAPAKEAQAAPPSKSAPASPAPKTSETPKPAAPAAHPAAKAEPAKPAKPASTQTTYYLQAGAYRSANDADAVKAQILMLGLPVQVQKAQINGATINRVRVGPFKGIPSPFAISDFRRFP